MLMLLMSVTLTAQVDYTQLYYPTVNRAELSIVEGDYENALQSFQTAFAAVHFSPSIDLYNAAVCALYLGEPATAKPLLIRILGRGVEPQYLWERLERFHPELVADWEALKAYPRVGIYEAESYRQEIYDMESLDQEFRNIEGTDEPYADTIAAIDRQNIRRFRELIAEHGFPGEQLFGAEKQILTTEFPGLIILRHYLQGLSRKQHPENDLMEILIRAVKAGQLEPNLMAQLLSLQGKTDLRLGGSGVWVFRSGSETSGYVVEKYPKEQLEKINEDRRQYGLDPLADYHRKAAFSLQKARERGFDFSKYSTTNKIALDRTAYDRILQSFESLR
ncbi:hypothetical protein CRP01_03670 [Flavilitoribacter nigricans DSM 23189 = NBRC 102662]|uniref:Tetratricopeptide repeat protein n=1 Tax=Flavilitoribacter nigricans (strain ATCC 23147 / DSM 23189 / NBRC 102662 / NCIMB 1420 / SS-2) TaxID=1122177 RepID=A0A2D0NHK6_FLAN2|nr:hypothetical protein CRP01_03670 [Flavilitoribacter nigricans DSM 23189 = NBRC 102662]